MIYTVKKENKFLKCFIMSLAIVFAALGFSNLSVKAATKTTIVNKIEETLENNKVYILNGFKYTYSSVTERLTASVVDNPSAIKTIVFYAKINGKQAYYPTTLSLSAYTALEDVIVFDSNNVGSFLSDKTIKNLYMASQNFITTDFKSFRVTNYHFVALYSTVYTDVTIYSSNLNNFNDMTITNTYYYEWNKHFFKDLAAKYNATTGATHNFKMNNDDECAYTKESFYPFDNFETFLEKCGVKYYHGSTSSVIPVNATNENFPYVPYAIDERVVSITAPLVSSTNYLNTITYEALDIRGYPLGSMSDLKGTTVVLSNSSTSFNTQYVKFKNIYFVYDPDKDDISSVSTTGVMTAEKIYIPEDQKSHFTAVVNNSNLSDKINYYTGNIKTDFKFTNNEKTRTYKSSDDFINIDTTLNSISVLEKSGITIPDNCYINEFLDSYYLPTSGSDTQTTKYELARFFVFTKNIDINKAIDILKPYMLYKDGKQSSENYTLNYKIKENNILELSGKYPDGTEFSYLTEYKVITSNVGEFAGCDKLGNGDFTLLVEAKTIKEGVTAKDLMAMFVKEARECTTYPVFSLSITLVKNGVSDRESVKYKNIQGTEVTAYGQVIITKKDINPDGFKDPFYTTEDEYGKASALDILKDKITNDPALKWTSVGISAVFGMLLLYLVFLLVKKTWKFLKR